MDRQSKFIAPFVDGMTVAYRVLDAAGILAALLWALKLRGLFPPTDAYIIAGLCGCLFYTVAAGLLSLYRNWRGVHLWQEYRLVVVCWALSMVGLLVLGFALKRTADLSRIAVGVWFLLSPLILCTYRTALRYGLRWLRLRGIGIQNAAVAGAGELGCRLARVLLQSPWTGYRVKGFYDDRKTTDSIREQGLDIPVLGTLDDLVRHAQKREFDTVFIALPLRAEERIREIVNKLGDTAVSVYFAPDLFAFDLIQSRAMLMSGIPVVSLFEGPFAETLNRWAKRLEDLVVASLALAVLGVPMALIALGVKLSSPGPVILRQKRYGFNGQEIEVWKFRTMTCCEDGKNAFKQATANDPRVTPFGRFLRKTSLDELPQLINVLQGRMSMVGPRPHPVALNEQYRGLIPNYMRRHKVKPGITGLAQVNGWRGETDTLEKMEKRVEHDLEYLRNWSLWLDFKIMAKTLVVVVKGENAY